MNKELTESQQDYLETIYEIILEKKGVKVKDIAEKMDVKNPSVTAALKTLEEGGYINYEPYGIISLTEKGDRIARQINSIHKNLKYFLKDILRIEDNDADTTACRMEHIMSKEAYKRFMQFIGFIKNSPDSNDFIRKFVNYIENDESDLECSVCLDS